MEPGRGGEGGGRWVGGREFCTRNWNTVNTSE